MVARKAAVGEPTLQLFGLWKALRDKVASTVDPRAVLGADSPEDASRILAAAPLARPGLAAAMRKRKPVEVSRSMLPRGYGDKVDHWAYRRAADWEPQRFVADGVQTWLVSPDDTIRPARRYGEE